MLFRLFRLALIFFDWNQTVGIGSSILVTDRVENTIISIIQFLEEWHRSPVSSVHQIKMKFLRMELDRVQAVSWTPSTNLFTFQALIWATSARRPKTHFRRILNPVIVFPLMQMFQQPRKPPRRILRLFSPAKTAFVSRTKLYGYVIVLLCCRQ